MAIVGAVTLVLVLVVLGGFFLYRSLPVGSGGEATGSEAMASEPDAPPEDASLYIRVVGEGTDILVREAGGAVLTDTTVETGQHVTYRQPNLEVRIGTPNAVEVYVYGERLDVSKEQPDHSFSVRPDG